MYIRFNLLVFSSSPAFHRVRKSVHLKPMPAGGGRKATLSCFVVHLLNLVTEHFIECEHPIATTKPMSEI